MTNPSLFQHPQQTWDAKKCEKLARRTTRNGIGTKNPYKGMVSYGELGGHYVHGMRVRYNGGCVRGEGENEKWYQGEEWPMPILAEGYEFVYTPHWGYRIVKKSS